MSNRSYDVIVFGATGTLGARICKFMYETSMYKRWAIMGRSHSKLSSLMSSLRELNTIGIMPDILIADAQDFRSLRDILVETRLLLNFTRPYRVLGKDIIEACLMARCDYMDLCSESYFIESSFLEFHEEAKKKSVYIVHACGFDSAISNLGVIFTMRNFLPDECNSIESFLTIDAPEGLVGNYNTYETLMYNAKEERNIGILREKIETKFKTPGISYPGPRIAKKTDYVLDKRVDKFVLPHFGSDASVMEHGIKTLSLVTDIHSWPQYHPYIAVNNYYLATTTAFYSSVCNTLGSFSAGRYLLKAFPGTFTDGVISTAGPTDAQLHATTFSLQLIARGFAQFGEDISHNVLTEEQKLLKKREQDGDIAVGAVLRDDKKDEQEILSLYASSHRKNKSNRTIIARNDLNETIVMETLGVSMCNVFGSPDSKRQGRNTYNNDLTGKVPIEMRVSVTGAEPYYVTTTTLVATLAQCLVEQRERQREVTGNLSALKGGAQDCGKMPCGGVFTPLSAFYQNQNVFDKLKDVGIDFKLHSSASSSRNGRSDSQQEQEEHEQHVVEAKFLASTDKDEERRTNLHILGFDYPELAATAVAAPVNGSQDWGSSSGSERMHCDVRDILHQHSLLSNSGASLLASTRSRDSQHSVSRAEEIAAADELFCG